MDTGFRAEKDTETLMRIEHCSQRLATNLGQQHSTTTEAGDSNPGTGTKERIDGPYIAGFHAEEYLETSMLIEYHERQLFSAIKISSPERSNRISPLPHFDAQEDPEA